MRYSKEIEQLEQLVETKKLSPLQFSIEVRAFYGLSNFDADESTVARLLKKPQILTPYLQLLFWQQNDCHQCHGEGKKKSIKYRKVNCPICQGKGRRLNLFYKRNRKTKNAWLKILVGAWHDGIGYQDNGKKPTDIHVFMARFGWFDKEATMDLLNVITVPGCKRYCQI